MKSHRSCLLSSTVIQMVVGAGIAAGGAVALADVSFAGSKARGLENPAAVPKSTAGLIRLAACKACNPCNPCAAKKACNPCNPCAAKKACNPCNPCAAKKACNPCNPCAAKKACNPCNPCAAKSACGACNPCNPCGGGAASYSAKCTVPRLVTAALCNPCNPCAAKKACNPCNPCAAKKACNPCNPCAAKKACNPCNPCAAKKACNPCNPCAAKKACNPCNPCAAKKACNPCNPCAAKKACNPCNPCAAKSACGPCSPCGAGAAAELTTAEARSAYECLVKEMAAGYAKSGLNQASHYKDWNSYNNQPYVSDTHGGRYVNNYANAQGQAYGKFEEAGQMPVGAMLGKDSFVAHGNGKLGAGPLFLMEKMPAGFNKASGNWRYTMVMPDGAVFGTTSGKGSAKVQFCIECHASVAEDQDSMMLLPDEFRVKSN